MPVYRCRVCDGEFFPEPLLALQNMPKAAQHLPSAEACASERGVDLDLYQCSQCGLVQLMIDPVPYYREVIRASAVSGQLKSEKLAQFRSFVARYGLTGKRVIEIGCGRGEFLSLLSETGVETHGLEAGCESANECFRQGLRVFCGYLNCDRTSLPDSPFDAFLLLMFLEHMPEPCSAFYDLQRSLAPSAVGIIEVPNFDQVLRSGQVAEICADHLLYFTRETLETTLRLNGFDVLACEVIRDGYVLSAEVRKREAMDVSGFSREQDRLTSDLQEFLAGFEFKRVAIWGAGHQAFAVLSLTGIADRIRYIVDGAPYKQGRYSPATHVPIVSPEKLRTDPVDAVIVMGGGYTEELVGILGRDYPGVAVAALRETGLERIG